MEDYELKKAKEALYQETAEKLLKLLNGMSYHDIDETIYQLRRMAERKSKLFIN